MIFVEMLDELIRSYGNNCLVRENGAMLLGPGKIPNADHLIFRGLSDSLIKEFLVDQYELAFPAQYSELLRHYNGGDLMRVKRLKQGKPFYAYSLITIYGLPTKPPFLGGHEMEEPFDLRVEDLCRHEDLSNEWLKFGSYIKDYNFRISVDLFVDTKTQLVFSVNRREKNVINIWTSIDECLCDIWESLKDHKDGYEITC